MEELQNLGEKPLMRKTGVRQPSEGHVCRTWRGCKSSFGLLGLLWLSDMKPLQDGSLDSQAILSSTDMHIDPRSHGRPEEQDH